MNVAGFGVCCLIVALVFRAACCTAAPAASIPCWVAAAAFLAVRSTAAPTSLAWRLAASAARCTIESFSGGDNGDATFTMRLRLHNHKVGHRMNFKLFPR